MDKAGKIAVLGLCVCLAVMAVCTVFFYSQNVKLEAQVLALEQDKASLQSQVANLQEEKADLQAQLRNLQDQYAQLLADYNTLKSNYDELLAAYSTLESDYSELQNAYNTLESDYSTLKSSYIKLQNAYEALEVNYTELQSNYELLNAKYVELQDKYAVLLTEYGALLTSYNNLVENYEKWRAYLETYISLTDSFRRTLSDSEILSLVSKVESIVSNPSSWWRSVKQLYDYVAYNIEYVYDEPFPVPPTVSELENNNYRNVTINHSYMSPTETLELGQGDCDDQAVLLYALVKAYNKYVYGTDYALWVMRVVFEEGAHLAVAFPVSEGELTIIDPAGHYYTGWLFLTSNDPHEELENYSNYWSEYGGITYITLYSIYDGEAYEVISGNIQEVADFIENY